MNYLPKEAKIFIAGHRGMVGSALLKKFTEAGYKNIVTRTHAELDLVDQARVYEFFKTEKFEGVINTAAKVGGILANNTYRADFLYINSQIQNNLIWGAHLHNVERFINFGSACVYPKQCPQPMKEEYLLNSPVEETNRPYAVAKLAGLELIDGLNRQYQRKYFSVIPCNLYGPNDNYDPQASHVVPAMLRKFFEAEKANAAQIPVWGTGKPQREFLHSYDLADAILHLCGLNLESLQKIFGQMPEPRSFINVGSGVETSIRELNETLARIFGFKGDLVFDTTKPDGAPRKFLDSTHLLNSGWKSKITLEAGLKMTVDELRAAGFG